MPEAASAEAPGRVNLIGEHTDYHGGFVLPTLIPQRTRVHLRARSYRAVHATSDRAGKDGTAEYVLGGETPRGGWIDYVQGVTSALARRGIAVGGFDVEVDSDVPLGAGVSSSAALTVALLRGLRALFELTLDDREIAILARAAETDFVGAPVGIMDPMACSIGRTGEALFLDTRNLDFERVPLPDTVEFAVLDSGVTHQHAGGGYVERRRESFEAAAALGVERLRDVGVDQLSRLWSLPPQLARRARHIITENHRVLQAVDALRVNDPVGLGALLDASHRSLRDDYQVSTPEVDLLVDIARRDAATFGARLTGGGFGGAVIVAMRPGSGDAARAIVTEYVGITGRAGSVLALLSPDERHER